MENDYEATEKRLMQALQGLQGGLPARLRMHHNRPEITPYFCARLPSTAWQRNLFAGMAAVVRERAGQMTFGATELGGCRNAGGVSVASCSASAQ
jgi:hypothetical protein